MKTRTLRVQRVTRLGAMLVKGHDVYRNDSLIARVSCVGRHNYSYVLYDESQEERVHAFINRWDRQLNRIHACETYFRGGASEIWPLVA